MGSCNISQQSFGQLSSGETAQLFSLTNSHGTCIKITNYGGIISSIITKDKQGNLADIVLGYDSVEKYQQDTYYLGAIIGRYAGRIDQGKFSIAEQDFQLNLNAPESQLHGGKKALNKQLWQAKSTSGDQQVSLELTYLSPDGEEGFPGEVSFKVKYSLTMDNELLVEYFASTDKTTIVNLTQHSYFNLAGHNSGDILNHRVTINADFFLPMNERIYPTGELKSVSGTPHDFTRSRTIGEDIDGQDEQIQIGLGYDNYWLLNEDVLAQNNFTAKIEEPNSGRNVTLHSDQPSMILYTANYIDGSHIGKDNCRYQRRDALCIEPQRAYDKKNRSSVNACILTPEQPFYSKSRYIFDLM